MSCEQETLIRLVRGELGAEETQTVEAHASSCASCREELGWLRAEARLVTARAERTPAPHVWHAIERRIVMDRERRSMSQRWWRWGTVGALAAAAALAALMMTGAPHGDRGGGFVHRALDGGQAPAASPAARDVLGRAEADYEAAIATLEADYAAERPRLSPEAVRRHDANFAEMKQVVADARALPPDDVAGRRRALRAYSAYLRTMQAVVVREGQP